MTVHSTQLGAAALVKVAGVTLYTVPTGKRTILKSIWARNASAAAVVPEVSITLSGGATLAFVFALAAWPAAASTLFMPVWVVMNEGDVLHAYGNATGVDYIASGAELSTA